MESTQTFTATQRTEAIAAADAAANDDFDIEIREVFTLIGWDGEPHASRPQYRTDFYMVGATSLVDAELAFRGIDLTETEEIHRADALV